MKTLSVLKSTAATALWLAALASGACAAEFDVPSGDLASALNAYSAQSGVRLVVLTDAVRGIKTRGVKGELPSNVALSRILTGTGFVSAQDSSGGVMIVPDKRSAVEVPEHLTQVAPVRVAAAAASGVETVVVTSSKIKGDIQTVPIAITALSQEQLTSRQIAGGPDLVKEVPNLTFSKTNFTGYNIQIRGIGTQAISVTTDPAVAVALNDIPFIRNHFFEQEFFDVNQVEVLRGPQGTLYGRNATAGVVNVITAKPTDQFEAMLSADWGNYLNRRYEGMVNIPITDDRLDLRVAGEWTKRDGYTTNAENGQQVDGRDLWSSRVTLGWKPVESVQAYLVWEHFQEADDRMRTAKQLCKTDPGPSSILGVPVPALRPTDPIGAVFTIGTNYLSQGCLPDSLYDKGDPSHGDYGAFGLPNGYSLPYVAAGWISHDMAVVNPYASTSQSTNLRVIETQINPRYIAKNDTVELNLDYNVTPSLTFTSQTGYNEDYLFSTEDYNRFNTAPDIFLATRPNIVTPDGNYRCGDGSLSIGGNNCSTMGSDASPTGTFCDPQLGCSTRLIAQDISREHAWQVSQEVRLASNFKGPLNFSVGGNYMHYETVEDYYVFANTLTLYTTTTVPDTMIWDPSTWNGNECSHPASLDIPNIDQGGRQYGNPLNPQGEGGGCPAVDPAALLKVNNAGHNYFLSRNPYVLSSYAAFGEAYYDVAQDVKFTGGIRWTDDQKHFTDIPSEVLTFGYGYASIGQVNQQYNQLTGRLAANWTPKLDFTDQTLIYGSFAHGYKAGGANPPGAAIWTYNGGGISGVPVHPLTFKPEFIDAYELGTKNTLFDGALTLDGDVFFYNYKGYQISRIVDRTAINDNFDATVKGAELEADYEPLPGLKFHFAGGYEGTRIDNGQSSVDLMDRTAGHPGWVLMKPFVTAASNCVFPDYVVAALMTAPYLAGEGQPGVSACQYAYTNGSNDFDPVTDASYTSFPLANYPSYPASVRAYPGFDPVAGTASDPYTGQNTYNGIDYGPAPNGGAGFSKNLSGNELPNAPHFTTSLSVEYTMPVSEDWAATLHSDFYWQSQSWARVFNDRPYDKIRGYSTTNLALILTSAQGWQVMGYVKNVFNVTAITGDFLNSDDSGLTTNVFLTDPRLYGLRITKNL